jgi:hypothetical protein
MEALRIEQILERDGELDVKGLPYKKRQLVEIILLPHPIKRKRPRLTVGEFKKSGLIGMWKDRDDIQDSSVYARQLREQAQHRRQYDLVGSRRDDRSFSGISSGEFIE